MKFCIASHQRLNQLCKKTLCFLMVNNVDMKDIYIFVSPSSYEEYNNYFANNHTTNIILSKNSIISGTASPIPKRLVLHNSLLQIGLYSGCLGGH